MLFFTLKYQTFESKLAEQTTILLKEAITKSKIFSLASNFRLPTVINKFTVIRSPHVFRTSQEQFETRIHKRLLKLKVTKELNDKDEIFNFITSLTSIIPAGVSLKVSYLFDN